MKSIFTTIFIFLLFIANAQRAATGSLTIFSEDGDKSTLILNGEIINDTSQTNLRVEDLNQPYYNAKIKFEDQNLQDISANNLTMTEKQNIVNSLSNSSNSNEVLIADYMKKLE